MRYRQIEGSPSKARALSPACHSLGGGVLKVDLDFCDRSKFRIPQNWSSSKNIKMDKYKGLNNCICYLGGFLIIVTVSWAPKPYSKY